MKVTELSRDQLIELKQHFLTEIGENNDEGTSYDELANADEIVSDEEIFKEYEGNEFTNDDFFCTAGK